LEAPALSPREPLRLHIRFRGELGKAFELSHLRCGAAQTRVEKRRRGDVH
jgi:hypothetical protein